MESDRHLRALGQLVSNAATLDFLVFHFMVARAGIPLLTANVLMGRDNFETALARLGRLVDASDLPVTVKRDYRSWSNGAQKAMQRRNEFVHSAWVSPGTSPGAIDRLVRHREPVAGIKTEAIDVKVIEVLAENISEQVERLLKLADSLGVLA